MEWIAIETKDWLHWWRQNVSRDIYSGQGLESEMVGDKNKNFLYLYMNSVWAWRKFFLLCSLLYQRIPFHTSSKWFSSKLKHSMLKRTKKKDRRQIVHSAFSHWIRFEFIWCSVFAELYVVIKSNFLMKRRKKSEEGERERDDAASHKNHANIRWRTLYMCLRWSLARSLVQTETNKSSISNQGQETRNIFD